CNGSTFTRQVKDLGSTPGGATRQRAIFVSSVTVTIGELENRFSPKGVYPAQCLYVPVEMRVLSS
ncbi:hypothetical protein J6590_067790, partial [Homalodisca vitripennis]